MSVRERTRTWHSTLCDGEEEESEVTREAWAGRVGGAKDKEEKRERKVDEKKMEEARKRGGGERKGDVTQVTKESNDIRVLY